jgi:hypothetical protein
MRSDPKICTPSGTTDARRWAGLSQPVRPLPVPPMAVVTVVTVTVIEVDTGLTIVAVIAVVPVMAIVRLLNNGVFAGGSRTKARWRGLRG